jgi:integrase
MTDEIAAWAAKLPARSRHDYVRALRQVLEAAVRWRRITTNPAKLAGANPKPPPRAIRAYTRAELDAIAAELGPEHRPLPDFGAATGLRPEEWAALERGDVDRGLGVLSVRRTVTGGKRKGNPVEIVELAKTSKSRRQVPLSGRALEALDALPARLDSRLLFPAPEGGPMRLDNFRRRVWGPAIEAAGVKTPARIYDLRSTFASSAIAAGIDAFELARVMGTSIETIERHYGTLLTGAAASIASRLDAFEAAQNDEAETRATDEQL